MRCDKLWLSQVPESSSQKAYFTLLAESNVDVEGRSEHGFFHGKAYSLSHDESKGLYILSGEGDHDAVVTRESVLGAPRQPVEARRIELNPVTNESRAIRANRAEGGA
jgi:hypothetical protein